MTPGGRFVERPVGKPKHALVQVKSSQEGVDGAERGASTAAREAEGDDEDEAMAGDENISVQRAEGGSGLIGSIAKKKRNKGKRLNRGQRLRQSMAMTVQRPAADEASGS